MRRLRPWHGVLFAATFVAVVWLAVGPIRRIAGTVRVGRVVMVDVTTGELFSFDVSGRRAVVIPEANPRSGRAALLGVERASDGRWFLRERHRRLLAGVAGTHAAVMDPQTGEVRVAGGTIRRGRP